MSDKAETFEQQVASLRGRFDALEKSEVVEIAVQLAQTYVVEGLSTLSQAAAVAAPQKGYDNVGDETFPGMLKRLKAQRPGDPVLEKFSLRGIVFKHRDPEGAGGLFAGRSSRHGADILPVSFWSVAK